MRWAYYIKYKLAAVALLTVIMVLVLAGNMVERNSYSTLDNSMSSIYKDRLQVSRYIYDISNALYKKRIAMQQGENAATEIAAYNKTIEQAIAAYETTVLTAEEKVEWQSFKGHLAAYNLGEESYLNNSLAITTPKLNSHFEQTTANLDALIKIQVGEGEHIFKDSHSMVNNRLVFSFFEISLLIVLGLCSLVILSTVDKRVFQKWQNQAMN